MITLQEYQRINRSYNKTLVFHFGAFAGFFSEYNNMLKAIAFCLVHKIKFVLYSKDSSFCLGGGWNDYFEPFTDEVYQDFHSDLNKRFPKKSEQTAFFSQFIKRKLKGLLGIDKTPVSYSLFDSLFRHRFLKWKYGFDYFTYELWEDIVYFSLSRNVVVPNCFSGLFLELIREIDSMIWRYNTTVKKNIDALIKDLSLPDNYLGIHYRSGDKIIEATLVPKQAYIREALKYHEKTWFLFTDDYSIITDICNLCPEISVKSFCHSNEHGYYHDLFIRETDNSKAEKMMRMLASVDILKQASFFIGTKTSNPYFAIKLARNDHHCISLDSTWK